VKLPFRQKTIKGDLVVIDSQFPQKDPFAFRNSEINEYIQKVENFDSYTMPTTFPDTNAPFGHSYGLTHAEFVENKKGYLKHYPSNSTKLHYIFDNQNYNFKLAYSFFLAETYVLLPFYEKHKIPFIFVLYPGGLFGLNSDPSDAMLQKIMASPCFRGVIVTQQITKDYLTENNFCDSKLVHYIYGGMVQFKKNELLAKRQYGRDKQTFDICFVAAKYSERGVDKGYDLFIETAKKLAKSTHDIMFHVVGGFDETEIDVTELEGRITFYGFRGPDFLKEFYSRMDIFLAPNRPGQLFGGNFDGFPLGIDAGYCGVALFVGDELKMNHHYAPDEELVILKLEADWISDTIRGYYNDPQKLYELSAKGQVRTQQLFDLDYQVDERLKVFSEFVTIKRRSQSSNKNGASE
jgi:glycosyltransferase involved in cell wall biosynthesis